MEMTEGDNIGREAVREEEGANFDMKDFNAKKQNLVLPKESRPTKDVGITIDTTTIPV